MARARTLLLVAGMRGFVVILCVSACSSESASTSTPSSTSAASGSCGSGFQLDRLAELSQEQAALDDGTIDCAALAHRVLAWRDQHGDEMISEMMCLVDAVRDTANAKTILAQMPAMERIDRADAHVKLAHARCPDVPFLR